MSTVSATAPAFLDNPFCPPPLGEIWARVFSADQPGTSRAEAEREMTDARWIARIRAGDEDAARALVHRLYPMIIKLIRCHLPRRSAEEDLVQMVFARVFAKLDQFSNAVPLEHWVSRIVVNTCCNQLRRELMRPELRMADLSAEEEAVVLQTIFTEDEGLSSPSNFARELVAKLLEGLNYEEQLVITLLHLEEKSVKEISRITGWSSPAVKVKAFRARHKMRGLWKRLVNGLTEA
jgi:RNA polymerase sigma-70 factor (ECF subfamily)